jgi:integrase
MDAGAGAATVILSLGVLHSALSKALKWGMIDRNPASGVVKPRRRRKEMRTLSAEQARRLLNAAQGTRHAVLLQLAVTTGLRQGEILALRWSDIDFESGCLMVQRQLQRVSGRGLVFSEPKTAAGRRKVVLGPAMMAALKGQQELVRDRSCRRGRWQENDLVFPSTMGTPQDPRNVLAAFKGILVQAGLPDIRFHDLRHTAASLMLQQGIHPKVVQERLGHSKINITLDIYSHVLPSLQNEAAAKMDSLIGGASPKPT